MSTAARTDEELVVIIARWAVTQFPRPRDPHARDDMLSDAYLGAVEAWRTHNPTKGASLATWCARRALGAIIDGYRTRSPRMRYVRLNGDRGLRPDLAALSYNQIDLDGSGTAWDQLVLARTDPHYRQVDATDTVTQLLAALPPMDRAIITRVDIDGVTLREAGAEHGITESGACQAKHRGYRRIREAIPRAQWKELAA